MDVFANIIVNIIIICVVASLYYAESCTMGKRNQHEHGMTIVGTHAVYMMDSVHMMFAFYVHDIYRDDQFKRIYINIYFCEHFANANTLSVD